MSKSKELDKQVEEQEKEITTLRPGPLSAPITCPDELKHLTAKQIAKEMPSKHVKFSIAVAHGKSMTQAYKECIAQEGSSSKSNSVSASRLKKTNPWVQGLIAKTKQELHARLQKELFSDAATVVNEFLIERDRASANKQHGPAVRALEMAAKVTGVLTPHNEPTQDKTVHEALAQIAGSNATLAKSLAHQLGIPVPEIVDAEYDE